MDIYDQTIIGVYHSQTSQISYWTDIQHWASQITEKVLQCNVDLYHPLWTSGRPMTTQIEKAILSTPGLQPIFKSS